MSLLWAVMGGVAWTASEYAIHRFVGHGPKRTPKGTLAEKLTPAGIAAEFNAEHLAHHANPSYFAPTARKIRAAGVAIPLVGGVLAPFVGPRRAVSFALGFAGVYGGYEVLHRWIHTRAPSTAYGRWARRHHLLHHHKTPRLNHGVTSPVWDWVTSSHVPMEKVRVPRHVAPGWMVDASGAVRPEFASDYELVGARRAARADAKDANDAADVIAPA